MAIARLACPLLFLLFSAYISTQPGTSRLIHPGSSLSPANDPKSWRSPSGLFAFGFYPQESGFSVGIWLVGEPNNTVVWTANRDDPPVSLNSTIEFTQDGKLVLRTDQRAQETAIVPDSMEPVVSASMLDSGNFVLYGKQSLVIWQSFDSPTDTLLVGQSLSYGSKLFSSKSPLDHSSGQFFLSVLYDGSLAAYLVNSTEASYWASKDHLTGQLLDLDSQGTLSVGDAKKILAKSSTSASSKDDITVHRATLDYDGNFRLYLHQFINGSVSNLNVSIQWSAFKNQCDVRGFCGFNSLCRDADQEADCDCLPGFDFINQNEKSLGCRRSFDYQMRCGVQGPNISFGMVSVPNSTAGGHPYSVLPLFSEDCEKSCLEDCYCEAASYLDGSCSMMKLPIIYARQDKGSTSTALLVKQLTAAPGPNQTAPAPAIPTKVTEKKMTLTLIISGSLGSIAVFCSLIAALSIILHWCHVHNYTRLSTDSTLGPAREFTLRSFSYKELEEATGGFTGEIHRSSFGAVYKGAILDGKKLVAVKRFERVAEEGEKEFRAEMAAIGHTHHKNLVQFLGFCMESSRKLLVYEFAENGSLADLLFDIEVRPIWRERVRIALEVARGILYLHDECDLQIIHCDITSRNILMDKSWTPKLAEFGLAKVLMPNQTGRIMKVRGTRGYVAPEVRRNAVITTKADIYSFGVVLLEIVCCRSNMVVNISAADEMLLCPWVYDAYIAGELNKIVKEEQVDMKGLERMVKIGLLCIQDEPDLRPPIKDVILMLEGIIDTPCPPCPSQSLVIS